MNKATVAGLIGNPIAFTFGPFASIYSTQYLPETDGLMVWGGALLALSVAGALLALVRPTTWVPAVGFALILPLVDITPKLMAVPLLALLLAHRVATQADGAPSMSWRDAVLVMLMPAFALLVLVKASSAIAAISVSVVITAMLACAGKGRLALVCLAMFVIGIPVFWVVSYQPLSTLPTFLISQWLIVVGYPDAMSRWGASWQILAFLSACAVLIGLHMLRLGEGVAGKCLLLGFALLLFLGFKEGFVRHGGRHPSAAAGIAVLVGWATLLLWPSVRAWLGFGATFACWLAIVLAFKPATALLAPYARAPSGLYLRLTQPDYPKADFLDSLEKIRASAPLPALQGSTDVYSYMQSAVLAAGLEWSPRPVMQTYSAFTPELLRADAAHLTGPRAPQNVVFALQPINQRLPMQEDGNSWPLLLSLYQPTQTVRLEAYRTDAVILRRRATAGSFRLEPLTEAPYPFGAEIAMPDDRNAVIWAEIEIKKSLIGKLWGLLFKSPHVLITYTFANGTKDVFRYIPGSGETGFVISPLVSGIADFVALPQGAPDAPRPVTVSIRPEGQPGWLWQPSYKVRLSRLSFSAG